MNLIDRTLLRVYGWELIDERGGFSIVRKGTRTQLRSKGLTVYSTKDANSTYTGSYWDYMSVSAAIYDKPSVLMLGLGGGTVAVQMHRLFKGVGIDAVEPDSNVVYLAKKYFLNGAQVNIIEAEGAYHVANCKKKYEIVLLDAFVGLNIPKQFMTDEFISNVKRILADDGIFVINFINSSTAENAYPEALKRHFKVYAVKPLLLNNTILICSRSLSKDVILSRMRKRIDLGQNSLSAAYGRMREL